MSASRLSLLAACAGLALLAGCAHRPPHEDYTAFQRARPATLLVLPPVNDSDDVRATPAVWAHATRPLAEAGYYVLPVTLVEATFRENGVTDPHDAQALSWRKLHDVFGADAAVYLTVTHYGTTYKVIASETRVEVNARIVDLRDGRLLWTGRAQASSTEEKSGSGWIAFDLVRAVVDQIVGSTMDASSRFAAIADMRLLGAPRPDGLLPGPRSPLHGQVPPAP